MMQAHSVKSMQHLVDRIPLATDQFSLKINIKHTECLFQPIANHHLVQPSENCIINDETLVHIKSFVSLGSKICVDTILASELTFRMGKTSAAYGKLKENCKVYARQ